MHPDSLVLSHWSSEKPVVIPAQIAKDLKPFQCLTIRFLYKCHGNQSGVILNQERDMNLPLQVSVFLYALKNYGKPDKPVVVFTSVDNVKYWEYCLVKYGKLSTTDELDNCRNAEVILVLSRDSKELGRLEDKEFSVMIVDDFDMVGKKLIYRNIEANFKIGLTHRNFVKYPDQRLQWSMLRCTNPKSIGTYTSFCKMDNEYYHNLCEAFTEFWHRTTWSFCENEKYTKDELEEYNQNVQLYLEENGLVRQEPPPRTKKRKISSKDEPPLIKLTKSTPDLPLTTTEDIKSEASSEDTIIYSPGDYQNIKEEHIDLPGMEEAPILDLIVKNLAETKAEDSDHVLDFLFD